MPTSLTTNIWGFITRNTFRKEIIAVLLLKLLGLILLWSFFFANPIDHRLTHNQLTDRYLSVS